MVKGPTWFEDPMGFLIEGNPVANLFEDLTKHADVYRV
jgi:hypothetical protein